MPFYRLYCIDPAGHFFSCDEFDADSDAQAIEKALERKGPEAAELWQQGRMVHSFAVEKIAEQG